jgi:hypothetical protein
MGVAALLAAVLPAAAETAEARPAASQKADALLSGLIETNDPGMRAEVFDMGEHYRTLCHSPPDTRL